LRSSNSEEIRPARDGVKRSPTFNPSLPGRFCSNTDKNAADLRIHRPQGTTRNNRHCCHIRRGGQARRLVVRHQNKRATEIIGRPQDSGNIKVSAYPPGVGVGASGVAGAGVVISGVAAGVGVAIGVGVAEGVLSGVALGDGDADGLGLGDGEALGLVLFFRLW
jgi:hypothetical protein